MSCPKTEALPVGLPRQLPAFPARPNTGHMCGPKSCRHKCLILGLGRDRSPRWAAEASQSGPRQVPVAPVAQTAAEASASSLGPAEDRPQRWPVRLRMGGLKKRPNQGPTAEVPAWLTKEGACKLGPAKGRSQRWASEARLGL